MNQDIKKEWVAALRDPNARQAIGVLETEDGAQCCLGVLCRIAVKHGIIAPPVLVPQNTGSKELICGYDLKRGGGPITFLLPSLVEAWADLNGANGGLVRMAVKSLVDDVVTYRVKVLSDWNDKGKSFAEIADAIESQL